MHREDLKQRTKTFAKNIIRLAQSLPNNRVGWTITDQIIRSATSVAANYRAVCRAKSDKDFISKMGTVLEEADETMFWLELVDELSLLEDSDQVRTQLVEANELISIFVVSLKTIKRRIS